MRIFKAIILSLVLFVSTLCNAQLNTTRVMEIGRNALYFEDYVLSIQYFNKVIDSKPFLHEPYFYRGLAKFYLDDFVGACEDFSSAIERNPYIAQCYQLRGMCHARMDSVALAEKDIVMAMDSKLGSKSEVLPVSLKKNGEFSEKSNVATRQQFDLLFQHVENGIAEAIVGYTGGKVAPYPAKKSQDQTACKYCAFSAACGFDHVAGDAYREVPILKKNLVLEKLEHVD